MAEDLDNKIVPDEDRIESLIRSGIFAVDSSVVPPALRDDTGVIIRKATAEDLQNAGHLRMTAPSEYRNPNPSPVMDQGAEASSVGYAAHDLYRYQSGVLAKDIPGIMNTVTDYAILTGDIPPTTFEEALDATYFRCRAVMIERQRKYGKDNITEFGQVGVFLRSRDKSNRLKNVYFDKDGNPRPIIEEKHGDESIDDTWLDTANYGLIALMLRAGLFTLPLKGDD